MTAMPANLFTTAALADAQACVAAAETARQAAERRVRLSPHGEVRAREQAYRCATAAALAAGQALVDARQEYER